MINWCQNNLLFLFCQYIGWSVFVPTDGFLLLFWPFFALGLLLSNHFHRLVFRCWSLLRRCWTNDRTTTWKILVFVLEILCTRCHDCRLRFLHIFVRTSDLRNGLSLPQMGWRNGLVYEFCIHDLGTFICHLLRVNSTRFVHGGKTVEIRVRPPLTASMTTNDY